MLTKYRTSCEEAFYRINKPVGFLIIDNHLYYVESYFGYFELLPSAMPCKRKSEVGCCHLLHCPEIPSNFHENSSFFRIRWTHCRKVSSSSAIRPLRRRLTIVARSYPAASQNVSGSLSIRIWKYSKRGWLPKDDRKMLNCREYWKKFWIFRIK